MTRSEHTEYHNNMEKFKKQVGSIIVNQALKRMGSLTPEQRVSRLKKIFFHTGPYPYPKTKKERREIYKNHSKYHNMILANIANVDNFELCFLVMEKLWYGRKRNSGTPKIVIDHTFDTHMDIMKVDSVELKEIDSDSSSSATDIT